LRLGAELEQIEQEWLIQYAIDDKRAAAKEAACERAGLPDIPFNKEKVEEWRAYQNKQNSIACEGKEEVEAETDASGNIFGGMILTNACSFSSTKSYRTSPQRSPGLVSWHGLPSST
jgi:hypothetical protein